MWRSSGIGSSPFVLGHPMRLALVCLAAAVAVIAAVWTWLGQPIPMPSAPLKAGDKLWCVSYAPFRGSQSPHQEGIQIPAAQIEEDIAQLAKMSDCVRVYATDQGIETWCRSLPATA